MAAQCSVVQHIVVDQGGCVDQLDRSGHHGVRRVKLAANFARQQHQRGPQSLSPEAKPMFRQTIDERVVAGQLIAKDAFYAFQLVGNRRIKLRKLLGRSLQIG